MPVADRYVPFGSDVTPLVAKAGSTVPSNVPSGIAACAGVPFAIPVNSSDPTGNGVNGSTNGASHFTPLAGVFH